MSGIMGITSGETMTANSHSTAGLTIPSMWRGSEREREIESALMDHEAVRESAVIGVPDPVKGSDIVCFVILNEGNEPSESLRGDLAQHVTRIMGKNLRPKAVEFVADLPRTRSMKIVRKAIRKKYLGEDPGDLASVENPEALDLI